MNAWSSFFYGEYGGSRAYLLSRALLLVLAFDMWQLMIGHAGRYGIDGFNVAHFRFLDTLQPLPSAASYVGTLLITGALALVLAFTGLRRMPALLLFALYTFCWSMSMLDSYQHHYFVSLLLLCLAFFPTTSAVDIHPPPQQEAGRAELRSGLYVASVIAIVAGYIGWSDAFPRGVLLLALLGALALSTWLYSPPTPVSGPTLTAGWGYPMLAASVAIVYAFTALAKVDANWMEGHTLLRISAAERVFAPIADLGTRLGLPRERVWAWISTLVIPQEAALGACYLVAATQDRARSRWPKVVSAFGFALAIVLHVGAEAMELQIGWFSYYMLLLAICMLLPLPVVDRLATFFTWPARRIEQWGNHWQARMRHPRAWSVAATLAALPLLVLVASRLDLPGASLACGFAIAALLTNHALWFQGRGREPVRTAIAAVIAAACMWTAIAQSPARWDFYRYLGGDLKRRGELEAALRAYQRGEPHAPPGQSRAKQIADIQRQLERRQHRARTPASQ
jgi:hypothetical protein